MDINTLDLAGIAVYFCIIAYLAYLTRKTKTFSEFSVAKHSVPAIMIFASLCATYVGPGFSVGFTSKGFATGHLFFFLALGFAVQTVSVGLWVAPKLSRLRDCHTLGDVMGKMYGGTTHVLAGVVSLGLCIGFSAVMAKIGGGMLQAATGLPLLACVILVTFLTALYTCTGGIRASIATDALQFSFFSILIPVMLLIAFFKNPESTAAVSAKACELTSAGWKSLPGIKVFAIALSFLLGETLIPPYANRALAAKSEGESRKGFLAAGVFCVIWLGIVSTLGIFGHSFLGEGIAPDNVFIALGGKLLPHGMFGLLLAAVIAIVMSSQDSVMNAGAVALVRDIVGRFKPLDDAAALTGSRIATIFIAAVATVAAMYAPSIIEGLLICYSIWAPALLVALLIGLFSRTTVHLSGWLSMAAGGLVSGLWQTVLKEPGGIPAIVAGIVAALIGYGVGRILGSESSTLGEAAS